MSFLLGSIVGAIIGFFTACILIANVNNEEVQ